MNPAASRWQPGAKVICIDDRFPPEARPHFSSLPRKGHTYTLSRITVRPHWRTGAKTWSVNLAECPDISTPSDIRGFNLHRFCLIPDHFALTALHHRQSKRRRRLSRGAAPHS